MEVEQVKQVEQVVQEAQKEYGKLTEKDCKGNESLGVKLTSTENEAFYVPRKYAMYSKTIELSLSIPLDDESEVNEIPLPTISSATMEWIVKYMQYKEKYTDSKEEIPDFVLHVDTVLEVMKAAYYLDI